MQYDPACMVYNDRRTNWGYIRERCVHDENISPKVKWNSEMTTWNPTLYETDNGWRWKWRDTETWKLPRATRKMESYWSILERNTNDRVFTTLGEWYSVYESIVAFKFTSIVAKIFPFSRCRKFFELILVSMCEDSTDVVFRRNYRNPLVFN